MAEQEFDSENNIFIAIVEDDSLSGKEKKKALVEALAFDFGQTPAENQAKIDAFKACKEYVQSRRQTVAQKISSFESTSEGGGNIFGQILQAGKEAKALADANRDATGMVRMMDEVVAEAARLGHKRQEQFAAGMKRYNENMAEAFPAGKIEQVFDKGGDILIKAIEYEPKETVEEAAKGALTEGFKGVSKKVGKEAGKKAGKAAGQQLLGKAKELGQNVLG